ncbi:site-specific integrase [Pseudohalioglobus lutimaris]|uniref:Integrase n=1 Tax=Pseudohalioglobus lutimaris TaxID=1737061 RepID=A0A2N5X0X7_9GAMM|nr:site-specific integrase [Pseudohalioglobus lutimaris]PLW68149.1 integrase [Pseudohalioglobus lutimaris]
MRIRLTQKLIDNPLQCPANKTRIECCDTAFPGLYFEVRATCTEWGTFFLRYKNEAGKTTHKKLGRSNEITLKEAREAAKNLKAEIQLGADPQEEARKKRQSITWSTFFNDHYLPHAKANKRSWKYDEDMHRLRINDEFGDCPLNRIKKSAIQQFHDGLPDEGLSPATADHYLKLIRHALNLAVDWSLLDKNPALGIKQFNVDNRQERLLTDEELQRLLSVLDNATNRQRTAALAVKLLLFTGARVNEALTAEWKDIDRKSRTWMVQATNSKSKRRRSIPLNAKALAILDEIGTRGKSKWLFTSSRNAKDGSKEKARLKNINKVWYVLRKEADLEHIRLHDLRHMNASMLINSGHSLYVVQQVLGHSDPAVTQRYSHLTPDTLQEAANSVDAYVEKALEVAGD